MLVRQLLGPQLSTWPVVVEAVGRGSDGAASPSILPESSTGRLEVLTERARRSRWPAARGRFSGNHHAPIAVSRWWSSRSSRARSRGPHRRAPPFPSRFPSITRLAREGGLVQGEGAAGGVPAGAGEPGEGAADGGRGGGAGEGGAEAVEPGRGGAGIDGGAVGGAVLLEVEQDVDQSPARLPGRGQGVGVVAVGPDASPAAGGPVERASRADGQPAETGRQRGGVVGLHDQVEMVTLHRELQQPESPVAGRGQRLSHRWEQPGRPERRQPCPRPQGHVHWRVPAVPRTSAMRNTPPTTPIRLPPSASPGASPLAGELECRLDIHAAR
jgi:hypothetical protein